MLEEVFVLAGNLKQACFFASHNECPIHPNRLVYVSESYRLYGINGKDKIFWVYGTYQERRDAEEIIETAKAMGFSICYV